MDSTVLSCIAVLAFTIVVAAGIIIYTIIKYRTNLKIYPNSRLIDEVKDRFIFIRACHKCDTWFNASVFWLIVEYLGTILPFELSAIILYLENSSVDEEKKQDAIIIFSILSMALIIMDFAIRPHEHMQSNRKAFINIDCAINTYVVDKTHNEKILLIAMNIGENIVNSGYGVNYSSREEFEEITQFMNSRTKIVDGTGQNPTQTQDSVHN